MWQKIRAIALILIISAISVAAIEFGVRSLAPQRVVTTYLDGGPLGLEDPVLGHRNRPNTLARVEAPEFDVEYFIDANGYRGKPGAESGSPGPEAPTLLLLGDSFTFGAANDIDDIWPSVLSQHFKADGHPVNIVNAGVPGYNTSQQALYLERLFDETQPDLVVVMFLPNDLYANEPIRMVDGTEVAVADATAVIGAGGGKRSSLQSVSLLKRLLMQSDVIYRSLYMMTPRREFFQTPASGLFLKKLDATEAALERMGRYCTERGADLVVVSVPQLFQVLQEASGKQRENLNVRIPDEMLAPFAAEWDIHWVSVFDSLVKAYSVGDEIPYHRYDGHLNAFGNRVVADAIHEAVLALIDR